MRLFSGKALLQSGDLSQIEKYPYFKKNTACKLLKKGDAENGGEGGIPPLLHWATYPDVYIIVGRVGCAHPTSELRLFPRKSIFDIVPDDV